METSRTKNALLNIFVGIFSQVGILVLTFVGRSVFVHYLNSEYLGINGLYNNILSVLALAELGLGNVTQFYLYKPVAQNDEKTITSMVKLFRKMYFIISMIILIVGIMIIPLLKFIVNSNLTQTELVFYYVLFLVNSVISYFSAHNIALLAANQDTRLQKYILLIVNFFTQIVQIFTLAIWKSYSIYILVSVIATLMNVNVINLICKKKYKYLSYIECEKLPSDLKKGIYKKIKSTFIYKIGATIVNNTDNILISIMVSTLAVGLYSNYHMIIAGVQGFIAIVTTALIPGIGNLSTCGDKEKMESVFNTMLFIYQIIATFGAISFYFLFAEFIPIWIGEKYLLDNFTVFTIVLSFYLTNAISPIWMFREANGLFDKVKYLLMSTAILNIIFSIILGRYLGMAGILLATSIARILTQVWYEPKILFREVFSQSTKKYWYKQLWYVLLTIITFGICGMISYILPNGLIGIILKGFVYVVVTILVFVIGNFRNKVMKEIKMIIVNKIEKSRRKR